MKEKEKKRVGEREELHSMYRQVRITRIIVKPHDRNVYIVLVEMTKLPNCRTLPLPLPDTRHQRPDRQTESSVHLF